jgi:mRNA interferase MazF
MFKRFLEWALLKEKLQANTPTPPFVRERDVWWMSMGDNIGSEINGKSKLFSRPAVIYKKFSSNFFLVVPTTSQRKEGSWYVPIQLNGKETYACLHQVKTFDYRRFSDKLGQLNENEFDKLKRGFQDLYK